MEDDSTKTFQSLLDLSLELRSFAETDLLKKSFEIARQLQVTFYDAAYVALTKEYNTTLVTADKDLHSKVKRFCDSQLLSEIDFEQLV